MSKTINVGEEVDFASFKNIYQDAWEAGVRGCTTFRISGKRFGIFKTLEEEETPKSEIQEVPEQPGEETMAEACFIDPQTGQRECS